MHPCYILHQRPFRETSLILDVFSVEYGRVDLVARGAKRSKSGRNNILQPARKLHLAWSARSEMGTLTAAEVSDASPDIRGRELLTVFYINELLIRMLHKHEPHPELFNIYDATLATLGPAERVEKILRVFEKHLLNTLGYGLVLDHEPETGKKIKRDAQYYYLLNHGPASIRPDVAGHVPISGQALLALENEAAWNDDIAREIKGLMRFVLDEHIGGRPLQSRALYKAYLRNIS